MHSGPRTSFYRYLGISLKFSSNCVDEYNTGGGYRTNRGTRKFVPKERSMTDRGTTRWICYTHIFVIIAIVAFIMAAGGCTLSVGAEGRAFYPADKSPRKGFYDAGGMDGIYSRPASGSFATLGGSH